MVIGKSWLLPSALGVLLMAALTPLLPLNRQDVIALSMGKNCTAGELCRSILYITCQPEVDGPAYYVDFPTGDVISTCGGACRLLEHKDQCNSLCPPPEWTCGKER